MGVLDSLNQKLKDSQEITKKSSKELSSKFDEIVEKLNWVMKAQQEIADHHKIKLDDPLELD